MVEFFKKYKEALIIVIILFLSSFFIYLVINTNIYVNYQLIENEFEKISLSENEDDYSQMMIKVADRVNYYYDKISLDSVDINDLELSSIFKPKKIENRGLFNLSSFNLKIINVVRKIIGMPQIVNRDLTNFYSNYSMAYIYEKDNRYDKAIKYYIKSLYNLDDEILKHVVMLHLGFCYIMNGEFKKSLRILKSIDIDYDFRMKETVNFLIKYVESLSKEKEKILQNGNSIVKAKKLTKLMNYKVALNIISDIEKSEKDSVKKSDLEYFKGVCYDRMGNKKEALKSYVKVIKSAPKEIKKKANRRLFFSSYQLKNGEQIREKTIKIANKLGDSKITKVKKYLDSSGIKKSVEQQQFLKNEIKNDTNRYKQKTVKESSDLMKLDVSKLNVLKELDSVEKKIVPIIKQSDSIKIKKQRKHVDKYLQKKVLISTKDNKTFFGVLITPSTSSILQIKSIIGIVAIRKKDVKKIQILK